MEPAQLQGTETDVTPIVLAAVQAARARTGRDLEVLLPANAIAIVDPCAFGAIVDQLLDNALVFSAAPSPVTVTVDCSGDGLLLMVRDAGIGMTAPETIRCFDRAWHGTGETAGDGLGLFMVRSLAAAMGGRVTVGSRPGAGSTFIVAFAPAFGTIDSTSRVARATVRT